MLVHELCKLESVTLGRRLWGVPVQACEIQKVPKPLAHQGSDTLILSKLSPHTKNHEVIPSLSPRGSEKKVPPSAQALHVHENL